LAGRDITEGRGDKRGSNAITDPSLGKSIAVDIGVVSSSAIWQNTDLSYDVAIGGLPFIYAISDSRPYLRQTAPFKKDQFDNGSEPGEQSLYGWWVRSQSSFHSGTGIKFHETQRSYAAADSKYTRFGDSRNVDVFSTEGQVTLLKETTNSISTGTYKLISGVSGSTDVAIAYIPGASTIKDIKADGTTLTTYAATSSAILDVVSNGTTLFIADATRIYYQTIGSTATLSNHYNTGNAKVKLGWVKQRLVAGIGASIYELTGAIGSSTTLPTPIYTHPNASWTWTSISEGGSAIYAAGYAGTTSAIYKFILTSAGAMPVLTSGIIAAQLPIGEYVTRIESYLGYLVIGTNKGVRIASISDVSGDLSYGPLNIEASNMGLDFAFRDTFVWVTGSIDGYAGLYKINLANEIETLRFAYATDAYLDGVTGYATSVDFIGNTNQIAFTTSGSNGIAIQSATNLATNGYLKTGNIRYGTLEPKNFKRLLGRGDFTYGSMTLETVDKDGVEYDHISYDVSVSPIEIGTSNPATAQEYVAFKFILYRDGTTPSLGPIFKGYQAKATIATPRQRSLQFPVYCFDSETDKYNVVTGYEGKAFARIQALEELEQTGDIITWQDLTTGESRQAVIEQIQFTRMTPPDKKFSGFGGIIQINLRTV